MLKPGANETDVREEIATPLLKSLGYERGTANDISREPTLTYERQFLGRKKKTDPPLRGRADYILSVVGVARWVLEVKAPSEPIDVDCIEQSLSYARHPEVSAAYAVVLNGVRLTVHHVNQKSIELPLLDVEIGKLEALVETLIPVLGPAAIKRDCARPTIDIRKPLAPGLRACARVLSGEMCHRDVAWSCNAVLPPESRAPFDEMVNRLTGMRVAVTGGIIERDSESRIRAKLAWATPHDEVLRFATDKRLMDAEYVALCDQISIDPDFPSAFDLVATVEVGAGETLFDIVKWKSQVAQVGVEMHYAARAVGYVDGNAFRGDFWGVYICHVPMAPDLEFKIETAGDFSLTLDDR